MRTIDVILALFIGTTLVGCSGDDNTRFFYELVAVEEVMLPKAFERGEIYEIEVSYFRPTDCHSFSGLDFNRIGNERTVAIVNVIVDQEKCTPIERLDLIDVSFDFRVGQEESYIFRFWQGKNQNGDNQFLTIEIPVVQ